LSIITLHSGLPGTTSHPWLYLNRTQTLSHGRHKTQVFHDVLYNHIANKGTLTVTEVKFHPENIFSQLDTKSVMKKQSVPIVCQMELGLVEPAVNR